MRTALFLMVVFCLTAWAGPKRRDWQDAEVVTVKQTEFEFEEIKYRSSGDSLVPDQWVKRRKVVWSYEFQAGDRRYFAQIERKKALRGIEEGGRVRVAAKGEVLYVLVAGDKEHRLELLATK